MRFAPRRARVAAVVAALVLGLAACGSDGDASPSSAADPAMADTGDTVSDSIGTIGAATATTEVASTTSDVAEQRRIVPLTGDVAEIVFALGVGDDVVATDLSATYPPEVDDLPKFGFARALNTEPILEFEPTVAIGTDGAGPQDTIDDLRRVNLPVTIIDREFVSTGPARTIRLVAEALGEATAGDELATSVQTEIDAATVDASAYASPMRVAALYLRGTDIQFVLGEGSGIGWLLEAAGAVDIADELGITETAPITAEALLAAAPDVIIVPADGLLSAGGMEALLEIPGIAETPAGQRGTIYAYDDQMMLGNGPRTGQFLAELVDDLRAADLARADSQDGT